MADVYLVQPNAQVLKLVRCTEDPLMGSDSALKLLEVVLMTTPIMFVTTKLLIQ